MRLFVSSAICASLVGSLPQLAVAQERYFNFAVTGGLETRNDYPGASSYTSSPDLAFKFGALRWGPVDIGDGVRAVPENGLSLGGALNVIGSRQAAENPELAGLTDIDTAIELGLNLTYQQTNWLVFGEVRKGFGGHDGVTGTLGSDVIFRPNDRLTVKAGPRLNFGNQDFAQTYFGITGAEAGRSAFDAFDADGGVLGLGFEVGATYTLDENWALEGALSYERLQNDAADSPITTNGSDDQWSINIGLSRAFNLRF